LPLDFETLDGQEDSWSNGAPRTARCSACLVGACPTWTGAVSTVSSGRRGHAHLAERGRRGPAPRRRAAAWRGGRAGRRGVLLPHPLGVQVAR
jgi:hypothetical protein